MRKLISIFIVIAITLTAALVTPWLIEDPGYFYIRFAGYEIEMRLIVALGLLLTLVFLLWLIVFFIRLPKKTLRNYSANRSRRTFAKGLLALSEGKWKVAEKQLLTSTKNSPTPELGYMAAARAAIALNKIQQAFEYLDEAENHTDNPLTVDLTRCELWIKTGEFDQAVQLLQRILKSYPNNPRALHLLTQAGQSAGHWQLLRDIMPKAEKLEVLPVSEVRRIADSSIRQQLIYAENAGQLQSVWNSLNKQQKSNIEYIKAYAKSGLLLGMNEEVSSLAEASLSANLTDELLEIWSQLSLDVKHKIKIAEKWLKKHPDNPLLLMILGELCLHEKLWGKARDYLQKSLEIHPHKKCFKLLARYYDEVGEPDNALDAYRQAEKNSRQLVVSQNKLPLID